MTAETDLALALSLADVAGKAIRPLFRSDLRFGMNTYGPQKVAALGCHSGIFIKTQKTLEKPQAIGFNDIFLDCWTLRSTLKC